MSSRPGYIRIDRPLLWGPLIAIVLLLMAFSQLAQGTDLLTAVVSGEKSAEVLFQTTGSVGANPSLKFRDNTVELHMAGVRLAESLKGKLEISSPHALIREIQATDSGKGALVVSLKLNGSGDGLAERVVARKVSRGVIVDIAFPKGGAAALALQAEEQAPLKEMAVPAPKVSESSLPGLQQALWIVFILGVFGVGAIFLLRHLRSRNFKSGSRKFLIESMGYVPLGPGGKAAVALVKVGQEFVLVGVSAQGVTLLSSLPKLQQQYEEETRFERGAFKDAVEEEFHRLKGTNLTV